MKKIIDVSSYNGTVNWKRAKEQGVGGAILKIIRKDLTRDNQFNANYKGCESIGMPWGAYNYSYATTVSKAKSDMNLVCDILDKISKKHFSLGVWFDIEDKTQEKLSQAQIASIINAAEKVVVSRGYPFGVYTGLSFYKTHIHRELVECKNWWIARYYKGYDAMNISVNPNESYKPLSDIVAWQYTSSGRFSPAICNGNGGNVDLNVMYKEIQTTEKGDDKVAVKIGHASISEKGTVNGVKGDSTRKEVCTRTWYAYSGGWGYMAIHPDAAVREKHAKAVEDACANNCIGYGQSNRNTAHAEAKKVGYIIKNIKTKCNTDCSALQNLSALVSGAKGVSYGSNGWTTSTMLASLKSAGYKIITDSTYLKSADYCVRGAIYVKPGHHTVTGLTNGSKSSKTLAKAGITNDSNTSTVSKGSAYMFEVSQIKKGSKGNDVKLAQKILKGIGKYTGSIDGDFGGNTEKAVKAYQESKKLTADGIIGKNTWKSLIGV